MNRTKGQRAEKQKKKQVARMPRLRPGGGCVWWEEGRGEVLTRFWGGSGEVLVRFWGGLKRRRRRRSGRTPTDGDTDRPTAN